MPDDKDTKLATALRQAKQTPMFFAFVGKGSSDGVLIVAKKKISVKEINEAKAESGGKKVMRGRCVGEEGKLVFEMAAEPPSTLAKQLKLVIQAAAGMTLQVETRVAPDLQEEGESADEEQALPAPPSPPLQPDQAGAFAAKLKSLAPVIQMASTINNAQAAQAQQAIGQANTLFRARQHGEAIAALEIAEGLLKEALGAAKGALAPPAPPPANPAAARFASRLKALAPALQKAEATGSPQAQEAKRLIGEANKLYVAKQFDPANAALDQAETLIKQALTAGKTQPNGRGAFVRLQQCRLEWGGAVQQLQSDLDLLQQTTRKAYQKDARLASIEAAIGRVAATLHAQYDALTDKLDDALNAKDPAVRQQYQDEARTLIGQMTAYANSDPLVQAIDGNGLVPLAIKSTLTSVLPALASKLSA